MRSIKSLVGLVRAKALKTGAQHWVRWWYDVVAASCRGAFMLSYCSLSVGCVPPPKPHQNQMLDLTSAHNGSPAVTGSDGLVRACYTHTAISLSLAYLDPTASDRTVCASSRIHSCLRLHHDVVLLPRLHLLSFLLFLPRQHRRPRESGGPPSSPATSPAAARCREESRQAS